jgi:Protein of unknown function (DUF2950)
VRHGKMTRGFALVSYPVRWGASGIMTFIVSHDGIVHQQSLGADTAKVAAAMKEYNPGPGWSVVHERGIPNLAANAPGEMATTPR